MKHLLLASTLAASMALCLPSAAEAKVKIGIFFGAPHYDYQVDRDYVYRQGYGWYRPSRHDRRARVSCDDARQEVRGMGFYKIETIECGGREYTFEASRGNARYTVYVDSITGEVSTGG
jgi:hypothetical protein